MAIITIARELGAWGAPASQLLAAKVGGTLIDKNVIEKKLLASGVQSEIIERYDERKPGFFSAFSSDQDIYLLYLKTVMLEAAAAGPTVILGRGGHIIMGDLPNCLRVRLVAPIKSRLKRIEQDFQCDENMAAKMLRNCDTNRSGFCHFHFNSNWANPSRYDITINTEKISDEHLVSLLVGLAKALYTPEAEAQAQGIIKNRLLAQSVIQYILLKRKLSLAFLEVEANADGKVILQGATSTPMVAKLAGDAAKEVAGVKTVENRIQVAVELSHGHM